MDRGTWILTGIVGAGIVWMIVSALRSRPGPMSPIQAPPTEPVPSDPRWIGQAALPRLPGEDAPARTVAADEIAGAGEGALVVTLPGGLVVSASTRDQAWLDAFIAAWPTTVESVERAARGLWLNVHGNAGEGATPPASMIGTFVETELDCESERSATISTRFTWQPPGDHHLITFELDDGRVTGVVVDG